MADEECMEQTYTPSHTAYRYCQLCYIYLFTRTFKPTSNRLIAVHYYCLQNHDLLATDPEISSRLGRGVGWGICTPQ